MLLRSLRLGRLLSIRHHIREASSSSGAGRRKTPFPGDEVFVPQEPEVRAVSESSLDCVPEFSSSLLSHLERLSLVRFTDEQAVASLRESIRIANRLKKVSVEDIEPMHTVWEEQDCTVHEDTPEEPLVLDKVLGNAAERREDYFVTPLGNIPLEQSAASLDLQLINQWDTRGVAKPEMPKARKKINSDK